MLSTTLFFLATALQITGAASENDGAYVDSFDNGVKTTIALVSGKQAYSHTIYIGSEQKKFTVAVSLRSPMLWVPSVQCKTAACTSRNKFDPAKSQTFVNVSGTWNQDTYGAVNGVQGRDTVRIGSTDEVQLLTPCIFGVATTMSDKFGAEMSGYDGMLGLGVNPSSGIPSDPFLVQLDKSKTLDRTMFTVYMSKNSLTQGAKAGSVTYGATDSTNCLSNPKYYKLSSNTFIQLKSISMGTSFKVSQSTMMPELVPVIIGPKADVDRLATSVGATLRNDYYEIGCTKSVPDFKFTVDYAEYTIMSEKLIMKVSQSSTGCALAFKSHQVSGNPRWYFGAPLFMQYCVIFDYTGKTLGFADAKNANTTTLRPSSTRYSNSTRRPVTTPLKPTTRKPGPYSIVLISGKQAYSHTISIGSEQKKFTVAVSLRSPMLWVPSVQCKSPACTSRNRFDPIKSQTFTNITGTWNQDTYGAVNGVQGRDVVRIGPTNEMQLLTLCIFGMATTLSDQFGAGMSDYDGMLGLGVNPSSGIPSDPFLVQLDKSKTLDRTMFTVYMNKNSLTQGAKAGSVTYGATDSTNCLPNPKYHKPSSNIFIQLKTISMGTFKVSQTTMMPELVPAIVGPKADVDRLATSVGATLRNEYYEIGCSKNVPDFKFTVDNVEYTITSDKLTMKVSQSSTGCALAFKYHQFSGNPRWYFGAPLFMQYCVIFDYTGKTLGFADARNAKTTTLRPPSTRYSNSTRRPVTTPLKPTTRKPGPYSNSTRRPVTTLRPTTKKKLAPVLHYAGIFVSIFIALDLM